MLPTLVRWWEYLRYPIALKWEQENEQDWDATHTGRGADHAAWGALLLMEATPRGGAPDDPAVVTIVMDLMKAFEKVQLYVV